MSTECDQLILRLKQVLPGIDANKSPLAALMGRLILLLEARLMLLEARLTELESGTTISGPAI